MESESKLKLKISKMFRSSFGSCKPKNVVDLMENPVFITQNRHDFQQIDQQSLLLSPKARPFPSICKTKSLTESIEAEKRKSFVLQSQRKIKDIVNDDDHTTEEEVKGGAGGKKCPPVSPCSPSSNRYYNCYYDFYDNRERKKKPKKKQPAVKKNMKKKPSLIRLSSSSSNGGWFSSEEDEYDNGNGQGEENEDETETFFSSRSFSSSSSESQRRKKTNLRRKRAELRRRRCQDVIPDQTAATKEDVGVGIGESFAVVKRSRDPHSDFRTSMVEMIIEKQIFSAKDLEKLLQCFLSLNSSHHHRVIVQVFTEIWDALFSNYL